MQLHDLSFVRSGDKGDIANVVVMARSPEAYEIIEQHLVPETIGEHMGELVSGDISVYKLPKIETFQVVLEGALGGGATRSLRMDGTGKTICTILSRMSIPEDAS